MIVTSKLLNWLGTGLIIIGTLLLLLIFTPVLTQEINYQINQLKKDSPESPSTYQLVETQQEAEAVINEPKLASTPLLIPQSFDFSLVIPKISINAIVFPNINSSNEQEYLPILKKGVAHAQGSSLPDQPGPVFIFAHSTDAFYNISHYNAVFFLLNKLKTNDDIFIFYQNKKYHYQVSEKKIIAPDQVSQEVKSSNQNRLILQTCYPPGTTLKRLLIIAQPIN